MAPRFDIEQRTLALSVADLLARRAAVGPGSALRGGMERLWLGQAIHARYQEQALADDSGYRREVPLSRELELAPSDWRAVLSGRADGLRRAADGALVVEEIKSFRGGPTRGALARELAEAQARAYAWIAAAEEPRVRAELIWIELGGDRVEREPLETDLAAIEAEIREEIALLVAEFEEDRRGRDARRAAASDLRFPHAEPRPQQRAIASAVEKALEQREHLLVQAATGTGKTAATLFPAVRFALEHDRRVYVLTAKTTQQEMALRVLDALSPARAFHTLRLRAKARMCANDELLCHEDWCRYLADFSEKLAATGVVEALLAAGPALLPDAIFAAAREREVCPFEVSLVLRRRAQAVVCDYNYVFDPYAALTEFGPDGDPADAILVIDEVHNLIERARDYHSPELLASVWHDVARFGRQEQAAIGAEIADAASELAAQIELAVDAAAPDGARAGFAAEAAFPEDDLFALRGRLDRAFVDYLEHRTRTRSLRAEDPFVAAYFELLRFLGALARTDPSRARFVTRSAREARLRVLCRDPGHFLRDVLDRCHSAIGLSATLAPLDFHRALLGFDAARTAQLVLPDPFPRENRAVVIDASVGTTLRERASNYAPIAARLSAFADAVPGNCLALFPSYAFLAEVAKRLVPETKRVLVQRPDDSERERDAILGALRGAYAGDALLLAVCGGAFAEGVDYPNGALRAVAVIGPALPALSPERELLRAWFEERFEGGFEHAYVVPGMTRVVQAAGRLIRSERDCGVIALFDHRFLEPPFCDLLPPEWVPAAGVEALAGDPVTVAREFFAPE